LTIASYTAERSCLVIMPPVRIVTSAMVHKKALPR
jgi:hypothetical protein